MAKRLTDKTVAEEPRLRGVSKDGGNARTCSHPSRRALGRAPQDEVGDDGQTCDTPSHTAFAHLARFQLAHQMVAIALRRAIIHRDPTSKQA